MGLTLNRRIHKRRQLGGAGVRAAFTIISTIIVTITVAAAVTIIVTIIVISLSSSSSSDRQFVRQQSASFCLLRVWRARFHILCCSDDNSEPEKYAIIITIIITIIVTITVTIIITIIVTIIVILSSSSSVESCCREAFCLQNASRKTGSRKASL